MQRAENYTIRPFQAQDSEPLSNLRIASIRDLGRTEYSADQVAAWLARHPGPSLFIDRAQAGALIWVAECAGELGGYALLEPDGHLDHLYTSPDHSRCGLALALLTEAENYAGEAGLPRLFTEASELARPAFEKAGYRVLHRRDFSLTHKGREVAIHNYAMEKRLI